MQNAQENPTRSRPASEPRRRRKRRRGRSRSQTPYISIKESIWLSTRYIRSIGRDIMVVMLAVALLGLVLLLFLLGGCFSDQLFECHVIAFFLWISLGLGIFFCLLVRLPSFDVRGKGGLCMYVPLRRSLRR